MNIATTSLYWSGLEWLGDLEAAVAVLADHGGEVRVLAASRGFSELMGVDPDSIVGRRIADLTFTEAAVLISGILEAARAGRTARTNVTVASAGGAHRRLAMIARPGDGARLLLEIKSLSTPPQISERRREALFDQLSSVNGGVLYIYDIGKGRKFDLSSLLGYPVGSPLTTGEAILELVHPDDAVAAEQHCHGRAQMPDGPFVRVVCRVRHADGDWRWIELRERVLHRDRAGAVRSVLGFAGDVTERRKLRASLVVASKSLLVAEAQERRRIARELHDSTAQHLVAIDLTLGRLERRLDADETQLSILADIRNALTSAHREVRTFSYLLHPPELSQHGLVSTLRRFADGFAARTGLDVCVSLDGDNPPLQPVGELALFRVAQEALMNVHHHARAGTVEIALCYRDEVVTLEVRDDGCGMRPAEIEALLGGSSGGVGMAGMHARMEQIGGQLNVLPRRSQGLIVRAILPLHDAG